MSADDLERSKWRGKTAVITGAASGIGASLACSAARRGMKLLLADVDEQGLRRTAANCDASQVHIQKVDVSDPKQVELLANVADQKLGFVDLLCNNAGVVPGGRHRPVWEFAHDDWRWAFDVNVFGLANGIRSFVPRLLAADRPAHILNTTSISGFLSGGGSAVYGASKHAAVRLSEALYASLQERNAKIRVSMLCPGLVNTRIFETERVRPDNLRTGADLIEEPEALQSIASRGADPADIAEEAFRGMEADLFYIITTSSFDDVMSRRFNDILERRNPRFIDFTTLSGSDARVQR